VFYLGINNISPIFKYKKYLPLFFVFSICGFGNMLVRAESPSLASSSLALM